MRPIAYSALAALMILTGCKSVEFLGTTDQSCVHPPQKQEVGQERLDHLQFFSSVRQFDITSTLDPAHVQQQVQSVAGDTRELLLLANDSSAFTGSNASSVATVDDISYGRNALYTDQSSTDAFFASQSPSGKLAILAVRNIPQPQIDACAGKRLISDVESARRANNATGFVDALRQRGSSFGIAAASKGDSQIGLGTFKSSDSDFAEQAVRLHSNGSFCAYFDDRTGKFLKKVVELTSVQQGTMQFVSKTKELAEIVPNFEIARYVVAYEKAYFRNGHVLAISFDAKQVSTDLVDKLPDEVKKKLGSDLSAVSAAIQNKLGDLCSSQSGDKTTCLLAGSLGSPTFVSRAGQAVQFSGVTVKLGEKGELAPEYEYPKVAAFAPQVLKVFIEAIMDAPAPHVPAVATSTACTEGLYLDTNKECLTDQLAKSIFPGSSKDTYKDVIDRIDADAASADATATSVTGMVIRGANIAALNNEAVAASVQSFAGVTMRKTVEKAEWLRATASSGSVCPSGAVLTVDASK